MSTTAVRMTTHAPSPSYVPRSTLSRPNSPALPPKPQTSSYNPRQHGHVRSSSTSRLESPSHPTRATMMSPSAGNAPTPRLGPMERSSSGLRHEVKGEQKMEKKERSEAAQAILNILSSLPAPLPETLPPTFLPTPSASPKSTTSSPSRTFGEYARSSLKRNKRKRATDSSSSASSSSSSDEPSSSSGSVSKNTGIGLGLGLGLSVSEKARKRSKLDTTQPDMVRSSSTTGQNGRSLTPLALPSSSPALTSSKKLGKSALRNEVVDQVKEEGKETWSKEKWAQNGQMYRERALLLKRHGDAYARAPSAHPQYTSKLPDDTLKGLLCLTDAVLLWLYAYFCDEQSTMRVRSSPYNESAPLRDFVRRRWETEMRKAPEEDEGRREMAHAMVGLMHLIEAVVCYHLTSEQLAHLNKRGKELATSTTPPGGHGPSPGSTASASPPGSASLPHHPSSSQPQPHPSPAARSTSSSISHHSPESQNHSSYSLPPDLLPLISTTTSASSRAQQHLLTSRHHLTLRLLRTYFPKTFENAITSELNDEALPVPGDNLGSARKVDIDHHPERFAWPIELGMCAPVAHTVAFGRCLVEEMAEHLGKDWVRVLE